MNLLKASSTTQGVELQDSEEDTEDSEEDCNTPLYGGV